MLHELFSITYTLVNLMNTPVQHQYQTSNKPVEYTVWVSAEVHILAE